LPEKFEEGKADLAVEEYQLEELQALSSEKGEKESFIRFAELLPTDMAKVWNIAGPEEKVRVQNLLFDGQLAYTTGVGILNHFNSCLLSIWRR
jgi:hypothetical protein